MEGGKEKGQEGKNKKWAHLSHESGEFGLSGKFGILPKTPAQHSAKNLPAFLEKILWKTKKAAASTRKSG